MIPQVKIPLLKKVIAVVCVWTALLLLRQVGYPYHIISEERNVGMEEEIAFTSMPPKQSPRVIFMGNCIFQTTKEIPYLNLLKKQHGLNFETGNFAKQGSTIGDLLATYHYVKQFQPDLLVIHLDPYAFGYHDPFYKHSLRKLIFTEQMRGLWHPVVLKTYSLNELADSLLYSQFPVYRQLSSYRYHTNENIKKFLGQYTSLPIMDFFPYGLIPNLKFVNVSDPLVSMYEFPMAKPVMEVFVNQLEADKQKAVFILQESADSNLLVIFQLPDLFKGKQYVHFYNFQEYWNRRDFIDNVHPVEPRGAYQVATRLLQVVQKHLNLSSHYDF